jgi:predicted ArsR family transcriptional regulator
MTQINPQTDFEPADMMTVDDLDTLKVLADPLRLRVRELMREPTTVKQVASELDIPPTKLYYHINLLEKHGLIQVVRTQVVSGIIEKHYQVAAKMVRVAKHLLSPSEGTDEGLTAMASLFDVTRDEMQESARKGWAQVSDDAPVQRSISIGRDQLLLTDEQAAEFHKHLRALFKEYGDLSNGASEASEDVRRHRVFIALFPMRPHKARNSE